MNDVLIMIIFDNNLANFYLNANIKIVNFVLLFQFLTKIDGNLVNSLNRTEFYMKVCRKI